MIIACNFDVEINAGHFVPNLSAVIEVVFFVITFRKNSVFLCETVKTVSQRGIKT